MKKIIISVLAYAAVCLQAMAATTTPVQLLSPAGSTSGQAIISTGASTAPTWGNATASGLTAIGANTVYGNFTGSSASPTANAAPSCSTANSALKYTSGTGLSCGTAFALTSGNLSQFAATTSAQLLGVLSDETGSGAAVFGTSPTITTPNIVGTATNNNASAGSVGEYVTSTSGTVAITTATVTNVTSISLTAGDWDVIGIVKFKPQAGDTQTSGNVGISSTSATNPAEPLLFQSGTVSHGAGDDWSVYAPEQRFSLAGTTTIYLVATGNHAGGTLNSVGMIRARRVR